MLQNNFLNFNEGYKYLTGEGKADTRGISGYLCLVIDVIFPGRFFFLLLTHKSGGICVQRMTNRKVRHSPPSPSHSQAFSKYTGVGSVL